MEIRIVNFYELLSQMDPRRCAVVAAGKLAHGCETYVAFLFGCGRATISHGMEDLQQLRHDAAEGRVRN